MILLLAEAAAATSGSWMFTLVFVCALTAGLGIGYLIAMWAMGRIRHLREERDKPEDPRVSPPSPPPTE